MACRTAALYGMCMMPPHQVSGATVAITSPSYTAAASAWYGVEPKRAQQCTNLSIDYRGEGKPGRPHNAPL
jgi:hypothetical protein